MAEDQPLRSGLLAPLLLALAGLAGVLLLLTRERARPDPRVPACRASASAAWDAFVKDDFALARDRLATLDRDCNGALGDDNARLRKAAASAEAAARCAARSRPATGALASRRCAALAGSPAATLRGRLAEILSTPPAGPERDPRSRRVEVPQQFRRLPAFSGRL